MRVTVRDRAAEDAVWGIGLSAPITRTVEIGDRCPKCGGPRGVPVLRPFVDDGCIYAAHCWANPCGHVDQYADVLREAGQ